VLSTSADPNLGGRDFDLLLAEHFSEDFKQRYKVDARTKPRAFVKLLTECEKLKKLMSANTQPIPLNIECFMEDKDVSGRLCREEMEQLAAPLFQRAENVMRACLDNASEYTVLSL
jgi:molecular chaperone DnaK (HSP70)